MTLLQEGEIRGFGEVAFIVQQMKDANGLLAEHVDDRLVVRVGDRRPLDLLLAVLSLTNVSIHISFVFFSLFIFVFLITFMTVYHFSYRNHIFIFKSTLKYISTI